MVITCWLLVLCFSKSALDSSQGSKALMLDPKLTYSGVPYYFGIDPVSNSSPIYKKSLEDVHLALFMMVKTESETSDQKH